jgi:hypothetical protein
MAATPVPPGETGPSVARWVLVAVVLAAIAALVLVLASNFMFSPSRIQRPTGLPSTAILVGTPEHYEFIDCVPGDADSYDCTMFTGRGVPYAAGRFRPTGNVDLRDAGQYWFDGSTVRLSGNRRLEPVEPVRFLTLPPASPARAN